MTRGRGSHTVRAAKSDAARGVASGKVATTQDGLADRHLDQQVAHEPDLLEPDARPEKD